MEPERRNDVGTKLLTSVVAILVTIIMGFAITVASKAAEMAQVNKVSIKAVEVIQAYTREAIQDIKSDIREIKQAVIK